MEKVEQPIRNIWTDAYRYYQLFHGTQPTEDTLERHFGMLKDLYEKHEGHPLATALLIAAWDQLDREWKGKYTDEDT